MSEAKDLVEIIKSNPTAVAIVDNDNWYLYSKSPDDLADDEDPDDFELANYRNIKPLGDGGYGSGNSYGGDLLQALAIIVGLRVESV